MMDAVPWRSRHTVAAGAAAVRLGRTTTDGRPAMVMHTQRNAAAGPARVVAGEQLTSVTQYVRTVILPDNINKDEKPVTVQRTLVAGVWAVGMP